MPTDYYDDGEAATDQSEANSSETPEQTEAKKDEKTALIPESLCPGMTVGDIIKLKIVAVHEDEYEVQYVKGDGSSEEKESEMDSGEGMMRQGPGMGGYMED